MKRLLFLSLCVVACSSLVARAETITIHKASDSSSLGTMNYTRTAVDAGVDEIDINLASFAGAVADKDEVLSVEGTWTVNAGSSIYVAKGNATNTLTGTNKWGIRTSAMGASSEANTSWVNLDGIIGTLDTTTGKYLSSGVTYFDRSGTWNATSGKKQWTSTTSTFLTGSWYTTGSPIVAGDPDEVNSLFAKIYVSTGADVTYTGNIGYVNSATAATLNAASSFTTAVPEPGTLAMLAGGLLGLIAYAWRKRK